MDDFKDRVKGQAIVLACLERSSNSIAMLLTNKDYLRLVNELGPRGHAAIHISIFSKSTDILSLLLEVGADHNLRNKKGDTPIHCACRVGFLEGLKLLCAKKIDTMPLNSQGLTPLDLAKSELGMMDDEDIYGSYEAGGEHDSTRGRDDEGRAQCAAYLSQVIKDRQAIRLADYSSTITDLNQNKQRVTAILRNGSAGRTKFFVANYVRPSDDTEEVWTDKDYADFGITPLFRRMAISVSSTFVIRSALNTAIMNFDEKKAERLKSLRSEWWYLYNERKEMFFIDAACDVLVDEIISIGLQHIQQEINSARTSERDTLELRTGARRVSFDIAHDKPNTPGIPTELSEEFIKEVILSGLENSSKVLVNIRRQTFSEFSVSVVDGILQSGLRSSMQNEQVVFAAYSNSIIARVVKTGLESVCRTAHMHRAAHTIASSFVNNLFEDHAQESAEEVAELAQAFVSQTIVSGISVLANRAAPSQRIYNDTEFSEKMVANAVSDLAQQTDSDHPLFVNAATEFGMLFSKHVLAVDQESRSGSEDRNYISQFAPEFVREIINQGTCSIDERNIAHVAAAKEFVGMILTIGLAAYDNSMTIDETKEQIAAIKSEFKPESSSKHGLSSKESSRRFVQDIFDAGMEAVSKSVALERRSALIRRPDKSNQMIHSPIGDTDISLHHLIRIISPMASATVTHALGQGIREVLAKKTIISKDQSVAPQLISANYRKFAENLIIDIFAEGVRRNYQINQEQPPLPGSRIQDEADDRTFVTSR